MRKRQRMVKYSQIEGVPRVALVQMHDSGILRRERVKEFIIYNSFNSEQNVDSTHR